MTEQIPTPEGPRRNRFLTLIRQAIIEEIRVAIDFLKSVVLRLLHLAEDTDIEGTIKGIKSGIALGGSQLWILICSVFIASIGLDTNSPAVIIGAMLISPLMSPILGIGLSAGINDRITLAKSLRNFGLATAVSLITSVIYFKLTPFGELTPEMKARTEPTVLDAFVALFGGLAGIIAGSRTEKTNAIPGVAIATALMPPLCTSGYGLASGRLDVFGGAFYLFFINAILISLSTYLIVRTLRFPFIEAPDPKADRKARFLVSFFIFLLLIPSFYFLFQSLRNITERNNLTQFIREHIHEDVEKGVQWTYINQEDSLHRLRVYYFGDFIPADSVRSLETRLSGIYDANFIMRLNKPSALRIELIPTDTPPDEERQKISAELDRLKNRVAMVQQVQERELPGKNAAIDSLKAALQRAKGDTLPSQQVQEELKALFPEISELYLAKAAAFRFETDTTKEREKIVAFLKWDQKKVFRQTDRREREERIRAFLQVKMNNTAVEVFGMP